MTEAHERHILVTVGEFGGGEEARFKDRLHYFAQTQSVAVHMCDATATAKVNYFRFAAAPRFRTW